MDYCLGWDLELGTLSLFKYYASLHAVVNMGIMTEITLLRSYEI